MAHLLLLPSRYIFDRRIGASENIKRKLVLRELRARLKEMAMQGDTTSPRAMETSDMEMEATAAPAVPGTRHQMENAWGLLSRARQLLAEGNPTFALQSVSLSSPILLLHFLSFDQLIAILFGT
jgi:hypothetical protein